MERAGVAPAGHAGISLVRRSRRQSDDRPGSGQPLVETAGQRRGAGEVDRRVLASAARQAGGPGGLLESSLGRPAASFPACGPGARRLVTQAGTRPRRSSTGTAMVMSGPKRPVIVGTAGHIDHGKTSLVKKVTEIDTDRLPEVQARGLSTGLGVTYF